jgi:hypothetical protein
LSPSLTGKHAKKRWVLEDSDENLQQRARVWVREQAQPKKKNKKKQTMTADEIAAVHAPMKVPPCPRSPLPCGTAARARAGRAPLRVPSVFHPHALASRGTAARRRSPPLHVCVFFHALCAHAQVADFKKFCNNELLIDVIDGATAKPRTICFETARLWLHRLGFAWSAGVLSEHCSPLSTSHRGVRCSRCRHISCRRCATACSDGSCLNPPPRGAAPVKNFSLPGAGEKKKKTRLNYPIFFFIAFPPCLQQVELSAKVSVACASQFLSKVCNSFWPS